MKKWMRQSFSLDEDGLQNVLGDQLAVFERLGVVKDGIVTGINKRQYEFPQISDLIECLEANWSDLQIKFAQGFDSLYVVPGTTYSTSKKSLATALVAHKDKLKDPLGEPLLLDRDDPVYEYYNWDERDDPMHFCHNSNWMTRSEFYANQTFPGYDVFLTRSRDMALPRQGQGFNQNGRQDLAGGKTPGDYLALLGKESYYLEEGMTTDGWLWYSTLCVELLEAMPDVLDRETGTLTWLLGSKFSRSGRVPIAYFYRPFRRASLGRDHAGSRYDFWAARSVVRISKP